jgi:hypothetical protein
MRRSIRRFRGSSPSSASGCVFCSAGCWRSWGKDLRDIDAVMKRLESEAAEEYNNSVWKIGFTKVRWIS